MGGTFERLTAQEAADRLAGAAGTTLPGSERLAAFYAAHAAAERAARAEKAAQKAAMRDARVAAAEDAKRAQSAFDAKSKFGWGAERISSVLLDKFDQFTARSEDHTRKLLWTLGTDPHFKPPADGQGAAAGGAPSRPPRAVKFTPTNFPRVCERFGVSCDERQAREIFRLHALPEEGVSMQRLTTALVDAPVDTAALVRNQTRKMHGIGLAERLGASDPPRPPHEPFKVAGICSSAWEQHAAAVGAE